MRKNNQTGRSMVEMLGVLAIIGVLSVGAIAGYQKAMFKYKLNKHAQQLNQIINGVVEYSKQFHVSNIAEETTDAIHLLPFYKKLNFIPAEMFTKDETMLRDIFNNDVYFYQYYDQYVQGIRFKINLNSQLDICFNFLNIAKEYKENLNTIQIVDYSNDSNHGDWLYIYADKYCTKTRRCIKDLTLNDYHEICSFCKKGKSCYIYIMVDS